MAAAPLWATYSGVVMPDAIASKASQSAQRVESAHRRLQAGDSLTEPAQAAGIADLSYMRRALRRHVGL